MSKTTVIKYLKKHLGEEIVIKYNLGCFSYSDIIMKNIKIYLVKAV